MNSTQPLDPLPARPSTASIRIRTIPHNANPTPQEHNDDDIDVIDSFDFVRDEYTAERLRAISGEADLEDVYNLELEVDTAQQSIAHLGELVPNLETLKLTNSRVESFRDLGTRLRNLKILWVTRCGITELDGIVALSGLQELYIAFNDVSDLSPLALHEHLTVLDLESNNVAELDQIEQLGTCQMLRDLTLDGNPISKRKAYRRIVGSLIPQLETLDYTDVSTKERRLLDDDVLAKLRRKCKDSADGGSSKSRSRSNTPKHHHPRVGVGGFSNGDSAPGSPFAGGGGLDGTDGSRNGTPAGTPSAGSRSRRGSSRRGLSNAGGGGDSAISELQMVAEAIKWGNTNGIARAQSATGSPRPRRELPRRPYSSSDHVELSSQLSQYKWHREQSGHAAHMLQLLEEIGVEEGSEVSSSSGLTMGSSVTFAGNPIMAMRARRMSVGDGAGDELANVLDEGRSALGLSPRPGLVDALSPMSAAGSGARSPAPEPTVEDVKHDLRTWNLDAAVAKLRIRAGRPASRPGTARSQSGGPASPAVGAARFGRPPVSVDSERSSGLGDSFSESRSPARFNHRHGSGGGSGTGGGMQAEVMLLGDDRHARANDLSADSHRLMNSSRGSDAGTGDLLATTSRPLPEKGIRRVGSNGSSDSGGDDAEPSLAAGSKKATSPGPASLFHARKPSIGWGEDGGDSSLERAGGSRPQQSKSKRASHSLPRHDDGEDVESSDGEGEIEEDGDDEGARTYRHLPDSELVAMLKKKPKKVPELQTRDSFRAFFHGCPRGQMVDLLQQAYEKYSDRDKRVQKRLELLNGVLGK